MEGSVPPAAQRPPEPVILEALLPVEQYSSDREESISHVVLHFMSALVTNPADPYNMESCRATLLDGGVSTHYIIDREGGIHRLIPEERAAWHAGKGTWQRDGRYTNRMNQYAIGIELLGMGTEEEMSLYVTPAEYAALDPGWIGSPTRSTHRFVFCSTISSTAIRPYGGTGRIFSVTRSTIPRKTTRARFFPGNASGWNEAKAAPFDAGAAFRNYWNWERYSSA